MITDAAVTASRDFCPPQVVQALSDWANVGVFVVALVAAAIAYRALHTWRDELNHRVERRIARRLLLAAYRVRDELASTRHPVMKLSVSPRDAENRQKAEQQARAREYERRLKPVYKLLRTIRLLRMESEIVMPSVKLDAFNDLQSDIRALETEIGKELSGHDTGVYGAEEILYAGFELDDPYAKQVDVRIVQIEGILKPFVQTRK
jgi:hypothetical protein